MSYFPIRLTVTPTTQQQELSAVKTDSDKLTAEETRLREALKVLYSLSLGFGLFRQFSFQTGQQGPAHRPAQCHPRRQGGARQGSRS